MKTKIFTILFMVICYVSGTITAEGKPFVSNVSKNSILASPPPVKPGKKAPLPRILSPVGHIYSYSIPGHKIIFNFSPNGRVYREYDNIGNPYTVKGNMITVFSNRGPQKIIGMGKISRNGKKIEWKEFSTGVRYNLILKR